MAEASAIKVAVDLIHLPSRVRHVRSDPLPPGVLKVLQIAAGEQDAYMSAAAEVGMSETVVREAAAFYIEQILLSPNADSYRVLGSDPTATNRVLRRNMALLMSWLHPDKDPHGERTLFAARVTGAWNHLKTPERRVAYDLALNAARSKNSIARAVPSSSAGSRKPESKRSRHLPGSRLRVPNHQAIDLRERETLLRRGLAYLIGMLSNRTQR